MVYYIGYGSITLLYIAIVPHITEKYTICHYQDSETERTVTIDRWNRERNNLTRIRTTVSICRRPMTVTGLHATSV